MISSSNLSRSSYSLRFSAYSGSFLSSNTWSRSSSPSRDSFSKYCSMVMPSGIGKSGRKFSPRRISRVQRRAISTVFSNASGRSENSATISSSDFRYCSSEYFLGRRGSSRVLPSWIQTLASWASKSSRRINRTSLLATTGIPSSDARATVACRQSSSPGREVRWTSR